MKPNSFLVVLNRRYRLYFNPQGGGWYAAYHDGVKRQRVSLGARTRPEAEAAVRDLDKPPEQAPVVIPIPARLTWLELSGKFLEFKDSKGLASGSIKRYKAGLHAFDRCLASQGKSYLDEVTLVELDSYSTYRMKKEKRDIKTAYNDSLVIKGALKWAAKPSRGLLKVNPALDWETPEPVKPKRRCYSPEEVAQMEVGVREWLRPMVVILAWTGLRIGELVNLRWSDVDLKKRILHVRAHDEWKPKGRKDRTVPLHPKVEAVLKQMPIGKDVYRGPLGGKLNESLALSSLKKDQVKLDMAKGDLHAFRRYFATQMMRAGVDPETVRQWGGWKSLETMLRYLADVKTEDSVKAMEKAAARIATA